jgi:recombination protein RecT
MNETATVAKVEDKQKLKQGANALAKRPDPSQGMVSLLQSLKGQINACLPKHVTPERMIRVVTTCIRKNPKLMECTKESFLGCVFAASELGLEPGNHLGFSYLLPFQNKGRTECEFQIGYKGYIELLYRSGRIASIEPYIVRRQDKWELVRGLESKFTHEPNLDADPDDKNNDVVFYAIVIKYKDGGHSFHFMTPKEIRAHAQKYSKSYKSTYSPWANEFDAMALKTVIKQMMKFQRLSIEQQVAASMDTSTPRLSEAEARGIREKDDLGDCLDVSFSQPEEEGGLGDRE